MKWRRRWIVGGAAGMVLALAAGFVYLRGGSTPVPVGDAVQRFREKAAVAHEPTATPTDARVNSTSRVAVGGDAAPTISSAPARPSGRPFPPEGVYVYATRGGDEVDVLGDSRHTYPSETTVTVRRAGCGFVERWDALAERWDERESCRTVQGDTLRRTTSHHEFFGRGDTRTLRCDGFTYPAAAQPGARWSMRCASQNTTAESTLTAVGWEDVDVGGVLVKTLHVHVSTKISGEQEGTTVRDVWGSVDTGVAVREHATLTSHSNQAVFGRTRYHEEYDIRLKTLQPRR